MTKNFEINYCQTTKTIGIILSTQGRGQGPTLDFQSKTVGGEYVPLSLVDILTSAETL